MSEEEIMSEEAFKELIDNLEIIEKLTPYGRKAIKYWVNKLQKENEEKDKQIDFLSSKLSDVCTGIPQIIEQVHKEYCELMNDNEDCCYKEDKSCQDCIREYSERIVKEEEK